MCDLSGTGHAGTCQAQTKADRDTRMTAAMAGVGEWRDARLHMTLSKALQSVCRCPLPCMA